MLQALMNPVAGLRCRSSSWDRTGANADHVVVAPGDAHALLDVEGAGVVRHIWITVNTENPNYLRDVVLEATWDGLDHPAVVAPLGDFFCVGHARMASVTSLPISVVAGGASGARGMGAMNCWFAMPFARGARVVVRNEGALPLDHFFYYVDYDAVPEPPVTPLRFHAHYRQERPTSADVDLNAPDATWAAVSSMPNPTGLGNYVLLDTVGAGHYVGCTLSVDHLNPIQSGGWFGEGDDMFFIDGRPGSGAPPRAESAPGGQRRSAPHAPRYGDRRLLLRRMGLPGRRPEHAFPRRHAGRGTGAHAPRVRGKVEHVPLPPGRPDRLPTGTASDDRTRPCELPRRRLQQRRLLVPDAPRPPPGPAAR